MKINVFSIDREQFNIKQDIFCGVPVFLVTPQRIDCKWTQQNRIFRSSVWSDDGELLSAALPKFTNFGENPEHFPTPKTLDGTQIISKIDGSLAILDWVNGQLSCRTRGTLNASSLDNYADFQYCLAKYPKIVTFLSAHPQYTLLCEITTPNLQIVINYGSKPDFWLIGLVDKTNYRLATQQELDQLGLELDIKRPKYYSFESIDAVLLDAQTRKGIEGYCLYSNNGQTIHKIKSAEYLAKWRFRERATLENTVDLYFGYNCPAYQEFEKLLTQQFDYECWTMIRGFVSSICNAAKDAEKVIDGMSRFVDNVRVLPTRRAQAERILQAYGQTNRANFCFKLLDGKSLNHDDRKKLIYQMLKK